MSNPKFKADNGQYYIRQIFFEVNTEGKDLVLYTLKEYDIEVDGRCVPSIHRLYVEMEDISEYHFALKYFDGWTHWQRICTGAWFKDYINSMRNELSVKLLAKSLNTIKDIAKGETRDAFQANKYLLEKGWTDANGKKGRPTKESVKREAELLNKESNEFNEDFKRLVNLDDYRSA